MAGSTRYTYTPIKDQIGPNAFVDIMALLKKKYDAGEIEDSIWAKINRANSLDELNRLAEGYGFKIDYKIDQVGGYIDVDVRGGTKEQLDPTKIEPDWGDTNGPNQGDQPTTTLESDQGDQPTTTLESDQGDQPTTTLEGFDYKFDDIFSNRPKYEIPQEVFDMLTEYQTGAKKLEDLYGKSRQEVLAEARRSGQQGLRATKESGQNALDIMRTRAYGGLPGEKQYYEQLGATTAGAVRDISQRGGGGSQGAIADIYGQQQVGQRDILAARAQYQGQGMEGLAGMTRQTGIDLSSQYQNMAQNYISANLASTQGLGQTYPTGTAMRTTGLGNVANYKDVAWQYNEYQPAMARETTYIDQFNKWQNQIYGMEMAQYGTNAEQSYSLMAAAIGGQTNAYQSFINSIQGGLGTTANIAMQNPWNKDYSGGEGT